MLCVRETNRGWTMILTRSVTVCKIHFLTKFERQTWRRLRKWVTRSTDLLWHGVRWCTINITIETSLYEYQSHRPRGEPIVAQFGNLHHSFWTGAWSVRQFIWRHNTTVVYTTRVHARSQNWHKMLLETFNQFLIMKKAEKCSLCWSKKFSFVKCLWQQCLYNQALYLVTVINSGPCGWSEF